MGSAGAEVTDSNKFMSFFKRNDAFTSRQEFSLIYFSFGVEDFPMPHRFSDVRLGLVLWILLLSGVIRASEAPLDRLYVKGGVILLGEIATVTETHYDMETTYAGRLKVLLSEVDKVETGDGRSLVAKTNVEEKGKAPKVTARPAAVRAKPSSGPEQTWKFEGGFNLAGKAGNSERFDVAINLKAELERMHDRFNLYSRYANGRNRGVEAVDELIVGTRYTNFFFDGAGFFARQELEFDRFEGLGLRSTTAAGLSYQFRNEKELRIEARSGFSYRYESYLDADEEDFPGMDVGVDINWQIWERLRFKGSYTFVPSVENFGDFIFEQDSGVSLPLDTKAFWSVRFGVATQFNSMPEGIREKLDTRYYTQLKVSWK